MYELCISRIFSAAHAVRLEDGSYEPVHGHNWEARVTVAAVELNRIDMVMDFHHLQQIVDSALQPLHNYNINELPVFSADSPYSPTAERVAWWLASQIAPALPQHVRLASVTVTEAPGCTATFQP